MRRVYIAATQQHDGKTTVSLGLYKAACDRGYRACFIKPVGQRYVDVGPDHVDEDAVLFKRALLADGPIKSLSPVTLPRGFTAQYIFDRRPESVRGPILEAIKALEPDHDLAIVEGTGHAGVGSVVDASNAQVARLVGAPCVMVTEGGIGRCIDELCLNRALFDETDVAVIGAIVNKVYQEKYDHVSAAVRQGLANNGIECLGVIPYLRDLTYPTMSLIVEELAYKVLCGVPAMGNRVKDIIVAAMSVDNMIHYLREGCLVIVPGDRVDNILACVNAHQRNQRDGSSGIAGMLLTGGLVPEATVVSVLCAANVPVLLAECDTATASFDVRGLVPKITERDVDKIALAEQAVQEHVDVDRIFASVGLR